MSKFTEGNWCHVWNQHMNRWEVQVAAAFGARVAVVDNPCDEQAHSDARLLAASKQLLDLAREYGSKCEACSGSAEIITNNRGGDPEHDRSAPCQACKHIWDLVNEVEA